MIGESTQPGGNGRPSELPAQVSRFVIQSRLGAGAFGTVYRAFDPQLDREVALKVPNPGALATPQRVTRFLREAKSAANLRHPHIVPVFDAGRHHDQYFIASAFIDGEPLADRIEEQGQEFRQAAIWTRQLAEALAYAHQQKVVHRDVKPANCMIDTAGELHLMDFGLAFRQDEESRLTNDGTVLGTPAYMAPEQAAGRQSDAAADQYSVGVVLYELLTGHPPFSGPVPVVIHNQIHVEPNPPHKYRSGIPKDLETICLKALSKAPDQRYADCQALADDLRRWLEGESILARRVGPIERVVKWTKRNPMTAGLMATVALVLVLGTVISTTLGLEANRRAAAEAQALKQAMEEKLRAEDALKAAKASAAAEAQALKQATDEKLRTEEALEAAKASAAAEAKALKQATDEKLRAEEALEAAKASEEQATVYAEKLRRSAYAANMQLAQSEWQRSNLFSVTSVLESYRPPGAICGSLWDYQAIIETGNSSLVNDPSADLRGWEWNFWARRALAERQITKLVTCSNFSFVSSIELTDTGILAAVDERRSFVSTGTGQYRLTFHAFDRRGTHIWSESLEPPTLARTSDWGMYPQSGIGPRPPIMLIGRNGQFSSLFHRGYYFPDRALEDFHPARNYVPAELRTWSISDGKESARYQFDVPPVYRVEYSRQYRYGRDKEETPEPVFQPNETEALRQHLEELHKQGWNSGSGYRLRIENARATFPRELRFAGPSVKVVVSEDQRTVAASAYGDCLWISTPPFKGELPLKIPLPDEALQSAWENPERQDRTSATSGNMALHPRLPVLAFHTVDDSVVVMSTTTGEVQKRLKSPDTDSPDLSDFSVLRHRMPRFLQFSHHGRFLAISHSQKGIQYWDWETGTLIGTGPGFRQILPSPKDEGVFFIPDGNRVWRTSVRNSPPEVESQIIADFQEPFSLGYDGLWVHALRQASVSRGNGAPSQTILLKYPIHNSSLLGSLMFLPPTTRLPVERQTMERKFHQDNFYAPDKPAKGDPQELTTWRNQMSRLALRENAIVFERDLKPLGSVLAAGLHDPDHPARVCWFRDHNVVVAFGRNKLAAWDLDTGEVRWERETEADMSDRAWAYAYTRDGLSLTVIVRSGGGAMPPSAVLLHLPTGASKEVEWSQTGNHPISGFVFEHDAERKRVFLGARQLWMCDEQLATEPIAVCDLKSISMPTSMKLFFGDNVDGFIGTSGKQIAVVTIDPEPQWFRWRADADVISATLTPDAQRVAAIVSLDNSGISELELHLFDTQSGNKLMSLPASGYDLEGFTPDGHKIKLVNGAGEVVTLDGSPIGPNEFRPVIVELRLPESTAP